MAELLQLGAGGVGYEVLADLADEAAVRVIEALGEREQQFLSPLGVGHECGDGRAGLGVSRWLLEHGAVARTAPGA